MDVSIAHADDSASRFVRFRGTVDRPLGVDPGGRVPPWLAAPETFSDDGSVSTLESLSASPIILPPTLPTAPTSSRDIIGAKGGLRCFGAVKRLVPAKARNLFESLTAAPAVEDAAFAPHRPASRGVAPWLSVF